MTKTQAGPGFELISIDPETGKEDEIKASGTWARCAARFAAILEQHEDDYEDGNAPWQWLRIQPATAN